VRREALKFILTGLAAATLASCGFQLRNAAPLNFKTVYVDAPVANYERNRLAERMRALLTGAGATVTASPREAEIILRLGTEKRSKTILSLTGAGRVAEYRLEMSLTYQAHTPDGREKLPETELKFIRDLTYDDNQYAAKSAEEDFLYQNMNEDAVQQILRHLRRMAS
jgi:LPS-assembly lipoprotein